MPAVLLQEAGSSTLMFDTPVANYPSAHQQNTCLIVKIATRTATVTSVTGGVGGTWIQAASSTIASLNIEIWYNTTATPGGFSVIANLSALDDSAMTISEWSGLNPTNPIVTIGAASGTTGPTSGSAMSSGPGDVFIAAAAWKPTGLTINSETAGFTAFATQTAGTSLTLASSWDIEATAVTQSDTWTNSGATTAYVGVIVAFLDPTSINKFYLHDVTTSDTGTLPSASHSTNAPPSVTASGAATSRTLGATIGVLQTSGAGSTLSQTATQSMWIRTFCSDPIAAQTIPKQLYVFRCGASESNTNSTMGLGFTLYVWRPSTGAVIGSNPLFDQGSFVSVTTTTEANYTVTAALSDTIAVTAADGDILVLEVWRRPGTQAMTASYTNTAFYDGTTESSATTNAAYVNCPTAVTMLTAGAAQVPYRNPMPPLIAQ
jgi:hypothetical protein